MVILPDEMVKLLQDVERSAPKREDRLTETQRPAAKQLEELGLIKRYTVGTRTGYWISTDGTKYLNALWKGQR